LEQAPEELALHFFCERGPVAAHDFHADELDLAVGPQAHVALARATRAVTGPRQEQAAVELLELELEPALDAPARAHVLGKRCGELPAESRPVRLGFVLVVDARGDEQAVGVAVEDAVTLVLEPALRPEEQHLARAGDRVRERGVVEAAGWR